MEHSNYFLFSLKKKRKQLVKSFVRWCHIVEMESIPRYLYGQVLTFATVS